MTRVLHFMPDDKFPDWAIEQFDTCMPLMNDYVLYNRLSKEEVVYVKKIEKFLGFAPPGSALLNDLIVRCRKGEYGAVVFHSLPSNFAAIFNAIQGYARVAVVTWGHEIYYYIYKNEYGKKTGKIKYSWDTGKGLIPCLRRVTRELRNRMRVNALWPVDRNLRALLQVDYICPVIDEDYYLFVEKFKWFKMPKLLSFSYGDVETFVKHIQGELTGEAILINNSATPTGNHVDVLYYLKQLGVGNNLIVPLNYGEPLYGSIVRNIGTALFGNQFNAINDFLPLPEYVHLLQRCRYVVMGHRRQQALANVMMGLWMGAKIFFFADNPIYIFLRKKNAIVYPLEGASRHEFEVPLTEGEVLKNREIVGHLWGREEVLRKTDTLLKELAGQR